MDQAMASSSEGGRKVRCVQFNDRLYTVGLHNAGLSTKNGLQWHDRAVRDQQMNEQKDATSHRTHHQQQQKAKIGQTVAQSQQTFTTTPTMANNHSISAVTDLSSWSVDGQAASWQHPHSVQLMTRVPCEAASVTQQMMSQSQSQITSSSQQDFSSDKVVFEDGLSHLRSLYESQLVSFRSGFDG